MVPQRLAVQTLDQRVAGCGGNAAVVVLVPGYADVATVTPCFAPAAEEPEERSEFGSPTVQIYSTFKFTLGFYCSVSPVLHEPEVLALAVLAGKDPVAHRQHAVVQVLAAAGRFVVDS